MEGSGGFLSLVVSRLQRPVHSASAGKEQDESHNSSDGVPLRSVAPLTLAGYTR